VLAGEAPTAAGDPAALADQIVQAELAIRDPATAPEVVDAAARVQQVAYRRLGERPEWEPQVLAAVPDHLDESVWRQATARREFRAMHRRLGENLPAWRIVEPVAAGELLAMYQEAEARFGVPWYVLASVNLVETGMGRIVGLSVAGAQGPMQFMAPTWDAYGMGGDVWNTRDAILGAANYLAANGGGNGTAEGLSNALFHYNRSNHYVRGVLHYAEIMRAEPRTFLAFHAWEIAYLTAHGDVILPVGYEQLEPIPVLDWLAANSRS
jgi:membrane-bound lytic murein transglycosylase B